MQTVKSAANTLNTCRQESVQQIKGHTADSTDTRGFVSVDTKSLTFQTSETEQCNSFYNQIKHLESHD